jgi:hypothetical protein
VKSGRAGAANTKRVPNQATYLEVAMADALTQFYPNESLAPQ